MNQLTNLQSRLEPWLNDIPDYFDVRDAYTEQGRLKARIRRVSRDIERKEDEVSIEVDKPRSNEAKIAKLRATSVMKDELAELEAELAVVDSSVKLLEYRLKMYNASNYRTRIQLDGNG